VQNGAAKFVAGIEGCYFNVMGLPVSVCTMRWKSWTCFELPEPSLHKILQMDARQAKKGGATESRREIGFFL
jgi:hypothetical protein